MSSDKHMRRDILQGIVALPLLVLAAQSREAGAQSGDSPVKVDTKGSPVSKKKSPGP